MARVGGKRFLVLAGTLSTLLLAGCCCDHVKRTVGNPCLPPTCCMRPRWNGQVMHPHEVGPLKPWNTACYQRMPKGAMVSAPMAMPAEGMKPAPQVVEVEPAAPAAPK
jgi:hypothetical protein